MPALELKGRITSRLVLADEDGRAPSNPAGSGSSGSSPSATCIRLFQSWTSSESIASATGRALMSRSVRRRSSRGGLLTLDERLRLTFCEEVGDESMKELPDIWQPPQ
jgi:hypothetical protein